MSIESNKAVVREFREAMEAGDFDRAMAAFDPSAVIHMAGAPDPLSLDGFRQFADLMLPAFSDSSSTVEDMIAEGDKVVSRITFRAVHTGDLMGMPATGRSVAVAETIIDRISPEGRIVESWRLFDQMGMMQQLGVVQ
jgi:predicted ester cyclase